MKKTKLIQVSGNRIAVTNKGEGSYLSLTDMTTGFDGGSILIRNWMRNIKTLEYLAIWERMFNPDFNCIEFDAIKNEARNGNFSLSVGQWIKRTSAVGITAKAGSHGGTYAHEDIALEFATWLSPEFKFMVYQQFKKLQAEEAGQNNLEWSVERYLSKANYKLVTDGVLKYVIPNSNLPKEYEYLEYSNEAELLNAAVFGITSKEWKKQNPRKVAQGLGIRDCASIGELRVLSNLESYDSILLKEGVTRLGRLEKLKSEAACQFESLKTNSKKHGVSLISAASRAA